MVPHLHQLCCKGSSQEKSSSCYGHSVKRFPHRKDCSQPAIKLVGEAWRELLHTTTTGTGLLYRIISASRWRPVWLQSSRHQQWLKRLSLSGCVGMEPQSLCTLTPTSYQPCCRGCVNCWELKRCELCLQSDGQIEHFIDTLQTALTATLERWVWDVIIQYAIMAYRVFKMQLHRLYIQRDVLWAG